MAKSGTHGNLTTFDMISGASGLSGDNTSSMGDALGESIGPNKQEPTRNGTSGTSGAGELMSSIEDGGFQNFLKSQRTRRLTK